MEIIDLFGVLTFKICSAQVHLTSKMDETEPQNKYRQYMKHREQENQVNDTSWLYACMFA